MELAVSVMVGVVFGCGVYLALQRNLLRFVFGVILMSGAVNVALFVSGRLAREGAPLIGAEEKVLGAGVANSVPQALILTAIVIGFGLTVFALLLLLRTYERIGTVMGDELLTRLDDPRPVAMAAGTPPVVDSQVIDAAADGARPRVAP